jgi:A/G-specific adenine glycosylase
MAVIGNRILAEGRSIPRTAHHAPVPKPALVRAMQTRLLAWFSKHARPLPWRRTRDPYRVLVSEFMLQQTQVSRVAQYYPRFLKRFSSVERLAHATPRAVREAWDGLGYYARARNLHQLAKQVSGAGRQVPDNPEELMKLPGVGRYTAGAVACFAYEKPVAAVDTNVARVIRRAFLGPENEKMRNETRRLRIAECGMRNGKGSSRTRGRSEASLIWEIAERLVPKQGKKAWRFNQAIMELGAMVCVARKPRCGECPVRDQCRTGKRSTNKTGSRQ